MEISSSLACGFLSGLTQSIVFNPYDRALYLSIKHNRPFLRAENWRNQGGVMLGVYPSLLQRAVSSGLYFPFERQFRIVMLRHTDKKGPVDAIAGLLAGAANGIVTAPINATKYALWSEGSEAVSAKEAVVKVYKRNGMRGLFRAAPATISRDLIFGVCYSYLRHRVDVAGKFADNVIAGSVATLVSSPWNYIRLKQYAEQPGKGGGQILRDLCTEARQHECVVKRIGFIGRSLNLGWGALRVGLGLGLTSQVFDLCTSSSMNCGRLLRLLRATMTFSCSQLF